MERVTCSNKGVGTHEEVSVCVPPNKSVKLPFNPADCSVEPQQWDADRPVGHKDLGFPGAPTELSNRKGLRTSTLFT